MKYLAIIKDSFLETIDFKIFYILLALSVLSSLLAACVSFPRLEPAEALEKNLGSKLKVADTQVVSSHWFSPRGSYRFVLEVQATEESWKNLCSGLERNVRDHGERLIARRLDLGLEDYMSG